VAAGCFIEAGGTFTDKTIRGCAGSAALSMVLADKHAAGKAHPSELTYPVPRIEDGLLYLVDGIGEFRMMTFQPETLGTLQPGLETGLRESGNLGHGPAPRLLVFDYPKVSRGVGWAAGYCP
jgi:hypothetical protein